MTSVPHRVYDFSFALSRHERARPLLIHHRRDTLAAMQIVCELVARGYRYGGPLLNQPPTVPPNEPPSTLHPTDLSFVRGQDLIVVTTRVPSHDAHDGSMKQVERAYTSLEQDLIDVTVPNLLEHCSRERILFGLQQYSHLREHFEECWGFKFVQRGETAPIKETHGRQKRSKTPRGTPDRTLVFHAYLPELYAGGPGCLMAFGMTGTMTLAWCYRLANDHGSLLLRPGFHVLQLEPGTPPERPGDLRHTLDWKLEPVLMNDFRPGDHVPWMLRRV